MIIFLISSILFCINCILYIKHFRKNYYKNFIKYERKFYNIFIRYLDYYSKQKHIPTKGKKELNDEQKSWKGFQPTFGHEVVILNFNSNLNVGNIYRSSCCLGVNKYHIFGKKKYLPSSQVGYNFIPIIYHDIFPKFRDRNDKKTLTNFNEQLLNKFFTENNYDNIFLIEQGGSNINEYKFKKEKNLFIFGNETFGIPENLLKYIKKNFNGKVLSVRQVGIGKSLNVSNCASIVLYEYQRQMISKI